MPIQKIKTILLKKKMKSVIVLLFALALLMGVYVGWKEDEEILLPDGSTIQATKRGGTIPKITPELLGIYADYAAFSDNAYIRKKPEQPVPLPNGWGEPIASYDGGKWESIPEGLPDNITFSKPAGKTLVGGLAFKIWAKLSSDQVSVVMAFRGTEGKEVSDWEANVRWVRRWVDDGWDQYDQVRDLTPKLVDAIHQKYEGKVIKIVATGHSLGGGLAQQAAYASDKIKQVFAFDPSPVTGYYDIPEDKLAVTQKNIKIDRIYERGEFASYARSLVRVGYRLSDEHPNITEIGFNFVKFKNPFHQHGIALLAENLRKVSSLR